MAGHFQMVILTLFCFLEILFIPLNIKDGNLNLTKLIIHSIALTNDIYFHLATLAKGIHIMILVKIKLGH